MRRIETASFRILLLTSVLSLLITAGVSASPDSSEEPDANTAPVITTEPITINMEDLEYAIDFEAEDPDVGDVLTWSVDTLLANLTMNPTTGLLYGIPTNYDVGDWDVNVSVNDGHGGMDSVEFVLSVWNRNDDPVITSTPLSEVFEDSQYSTDMDAVDIDPTGDILTWSLDISPDFISIDSSSGVISGLPGNDEVGDHDIRVNVSDGNDGYEVLSYVLTVLNVNDPPMINTTNLPDMTEDEPFWQVLDGYDIDLGDTVTWSIDTRADFLKVDPLTGNISGTPLNEHVGSWWVNARLVDGSGDYVEANLTFDVANVNDDPLIEGDPVLKVYEDEPFWFEFTGSDIDPTSDDLVWNLETDAGFISIDPAGNVSGSPENDDVGIWWVNVTLTDGNEGMDFVNHTLTVENVNDMPTIENEDILTATEDQSYLVEYIAEDIDPTEDSLTWTLQTDAGFLEIDEYSGTLKGTPRNGDVGEWLVNVTVTDDHGAFSWSSFILTVENVNDKPVLIVNKASADMYEDGGPHTMNLSEIFDDPDGDPLGYSFSESDNLTFTTDGDILTIIPAANWSGKERIKITATDGVEEVSITLTVTVNNINDPPFNVVINGRDEYVEYGDQRISGSAEDLDLFYGDSLSFTWSSDTMGQLGSGQEINLSLPAGRHIITLTVTDSSGESATQTMEIEVKEREKEKAFPWWIPLSIGIVLLLVILVVMVFFLLRKEPEPKEDASAEGELDGESSEGGGLVPDTPGIVEIDVYGGTMTPGQEPVLSEEPQFGGDFPVTPPEEQVEAPEEVPAGYPEFPASGAEPPVETAPEPAVEPPVEGLGIDMPHDPRIPPAPPGSQ
ncbi:MAG: putative Ig domain-containing protein [Thermoplasmatota archaeon]